MKLECEKQLQTPPFSNAQIKADIKAPVKARYGCKFVPVVPVPRTGVNLRTDRRSVPTLDLPAEFYCRDDPAGRLYFIYSDTSGFRVSILCRVRKPCLSVYLKFSYDRGDILVPHG